jgi:hypothetical protein
MKFCVVYCLLFIMWICNIYHAYVAKTSLLVFLYYHVVVGFGFWVSIGFGFRFGLSPELVFEAVSGFEFGFRFRVREVSWFESAPLPSLFPPMWLLGLLKSIEFWRISCQIMVGSKSFAYSVDCVLYKQFLYWAVILWNYFRRLEAEKNNFS